MAKVLATEYQSASEAAHVKNWVGQTVALRLDKVNPDDNGGTRSISATVFTADDTENGAAVRLESARIIGQLSGWAEVGETVIVHIVAYGQRGQVLAPPPEKDKAVEVLQAAFPDES